MKQGKLTEIINEAMALNEVKLHKSLSQQCEKATDFLFELIERYSKTLKNEGLLTSEEMTTLDDASDILYQLAYDIAHMNGIDENLSRDIDNTALTESKLNEDSSTTYRHKIENILDSGKVDLQFIFDTLLGHCDETVCKKAYEDLIDGMPKYQLVCITYYDNKKHPEKEFYGPYTLDEIPEVKKDKVADEYQIIPYDEDINESLTESIITENNELWQKVRDWYENELINIESNSIFEMASDIPEYDVDWCEADGSAPAATEMFTARDEYLDALTNCLFVYYAEDIGESLTEAINPEVELRPYEKEIAQKIIDKIGYKLKSCYRSRNENTKYVNRVLIFEPPEVEGYDTWYFNNDVEEVFEDIFDEYRNVFKYIEVSENNQGDVYVEYMDEEPWVYDESLTEARNPENDEVNAIIKKWANSNNNKLSKHDQEILDKYGISLEKDALYYGRSKSGLRGQGQAARGNKLISKEKVRWNHDDFDFANYLTKDMNMDAPSYRTGGYEGDFKHGRRDKLMSFQSKDGPIRGRDIIHPSKAEMDSLQPYRHEKETLADLAYEKRRNDDQARWAKEDEARIKNWKKAIKKERKELDAKHDKIMQRARATKRINDMAKRDNG